MVIFKMAGQKKEIITIKEIADRIFNIRKRRVMIDRDLADLYGTTTKALNQAVKRNQDRFPSDFTFKLTREEKLELVTNCDRFESIKHSTVLPSAFSEQGVAMLSSVIQSKKAIEVNIQIMRTFVKIRQMIGTNKEIKKAIAKLETASNKHDREIGAIIEIISGFLDDPKATKKKIGFRKK